MVKYVLMHIVAETRAVRQESGSPGLSAWERLAKKYGELAVSGLPDEATSSRWPAIRDTEALKTAVNALSYAAVIHEDPRANELSGEIRKGYLTQGDTIRMLTTEQRTAVQAAVAELASASVADLDGHEDPDMRLAALYVAPARWFDGWRLPSQSAQIS